MVAAKKVGSMKSGELPESAVSVKWNDITAQSKAVERMTINVGPTAG